MQTVKVLVGRKIYRTERIVRFWLKWHHWIDTWYRVRNSAADMRNEVVYWVMRWRVCQRAGDVSKGSLEAMACETLIL